MSVQMRTMLDVADNSGARKLQVILPLAEAWARRRPRDVVTAAVKEASPDGTVKKGKVVKAVIVRTRKEYRTARRHLHPLRPERSGGDRRDQRASGNACLRTGGTRAAREEVSQDCFNWRLR